MIFITMGYVMKKVLKWLLIAVLVIVVLAAGFVGYVAMSGVPHYETRKISLTVQSTPARVEHGRELALSLCVMCHLNPDTKVLSGTQMKDMPEAFGKAFSKNITRHPTKGIGKWSDGDIAWLLRTGIHPHTGAYVPPWMIKVPHMADEDVYSIIAWLRSDDPMLAAADVDNVPSEPTLLAKFLTRVVFKPFDYPAKPIPYPDTTNTYVYGKYLATGVYDCYGCHLADFADMNPLEPEKSKGFFGGGNPMTDASGLVVHTANITPDKATGIGNWTRDQFIHTMRTGIRPDNKPLRYPMARAHRLSDYALGAMFDYIKTVPAITNKVERAMPAGPWKTDGERLFDVYACTSCHGKTGKGAANLLLASSKYPSDSVLIDVIKDQVKYNRDAFMPQFDGVISEKDLITLSQYVRELCSKQSGKQTLSALYRKH